MKHRVIKVEHKTRISRRRSEVAQGLLTGKVQRGKLAEKYDVSKSTIAQDIVKILKRWSEEDKIATRAKRSRRVRQLELLLGMSLGAFDRSTEDFEEITKTEKTVLCPQCGGDSHEDDSCALCCGEGMVPEVTIATKTRGQVGDSSFLTVAKNCLAEISKIEGLVVTRSQIRKKTTSESINAHMLLKDNEYMDVPNDILLAAMSAIEKLRHYSDDKKVIEVKSVETVEEGEEDE